MQHENLLPSAEIRWNELNIKVYLPPKGSSGKLDSFNPAILSVKALSESEYLQVLQYGFNKKNFSRPKKYRRA